VGILNLKTQYYCTKCKHAHRYSSKIGKKHLEYKDDNIKINAIEPTSKPVLELDSLSNNDVATKTPKNRFYQFVKQYQINYLKGVKRYGIWWKIFHLSILSIIMTLIITAAIIFIVFLPKIEMIKWTLR
jgi:hypothetical protein